MDFKQRLVPGRLIQRYKRFLADVEIEDGIVTAHCPNPGSMFGLNAPGLPVWLSPAENGKRRLPYTLELIDAGDGRGNSNLVGINTGLPNRLVEEAIRGGVIQQLTDYHNLRREVRYGLNSRIDMLLEGEGRTPCYVEVKNVHLCRDPGLAEFPDCVTARGAKHLGELARVARGGARAVMVFCVQRNDCNTFSLARDLDPAYAESFDDAAAAGVETLIYSCHISLAGISVSTQLKFSPTGSVPFDRKQP